MPCQVRGCSLNTKVTSIVLGAAIVACGFATNCAAADDSADFAAHWHVLTVPGTWDEQTAGRLDDYDGVAWYRCLVTLPGGWNEKPLILRIENIDDAWEAYWNGTKLGGAGGFPPDYKPATAEAVELAIPKAALTAGNNLVAIRIFDHDNRGGFKGSAPALIAGEEGMNLNGLWEFRTGDDPNWAKGTTALANAGVYWRVMPKDRALELARAATTALSPADALAAFTVPEDLEIQTVLTEPEVKQPLFMSWDERGRLWVLQYIQYPYPAGLTMVSRDEFWRAVYDKLPEPPPRGVRGADKITIHEDTDGDGVLDRHKTFVDGLNIASSFAKGRGGVWVLNPPYLLFYPDANNDDVPDGDPVVHLQGFGFEDTHSIANSLRWGPDGWLYAGQGSTVTGNIFRPGLDKPEQAIPSMGQLIWRYHPELRKYEIFAEGGGNTFGVEFDAKGRVFSGHNGGDTRGFHFVQGGYYQKGFAKHGPLSNPYSFGYFPQMKHHSVPRFTHNFIIYEGGALPERYNGKLFGVEPLQGQVVQSDIFPDTSTFATKDINRPVLTTDKWFRPVDIKVGPDGAIYIADMYEPQISHREHFSGQIDKTNGRIYRLQKKGAKPIARFNVGQMSTAELVETLKHPNKWFRQQALVQLGNRQDASAIPPLKAGLASGDPQLALECLWGLNLCGGFDETVAIETLAHSDRYVRAWTVRLLCDDFAVSDEMAARLVKLAVREAYVEVRSQLASSARRLPAVQCLPIVRQLLARSEDVQDVHIPLLLWWAIESKAGSDRDAVVKLFEEPALWTLPIVREHLLNRVMRRYAAAGTRQDLLACAKLLNLAPDKDSSAALMKGFEEAFQGRSLAALPEELAAAIEASGHASLLLQVRQKTKSAVAQALAKLTDPAADPAERLALVQVFGEVDIPAAVDPLLTILTTSSDEPLQTAALTSLSRYKLPAIADVVIKRFNDFGLDARAAALTLLSSRTVWSRALLAAVDAGKINASLIPLDTVRLMTLHPDADLAAAIGRHWPDLRGASSADMQSMLGRVHDILAVGRGDPYKGKVLYRASCGKCHLLYGDGGRIGPDLTSYQRKDQQRILLNVINPSAEIREGFEAYNVLTTDGRVLSGFLFDQDKDLVVLRGVDGQNVSIPRTDIDEMSRAPKSLMPEGLLSTLSDQDIRDLFAYLQGGQPLAN
ncbi:MAG: PVC-type heme-binding CxxCH protein [Planctomycetaceae bacterium]